MVNYILLSRSQIIYLFSFSYLDIDLVRSNICESTKVKMIYNVDPQEVCCISQCKRTTAFDIFEQYCKFYLFFCQTNATI
jgi:hypothetical protein